MNKFIIEEIIKKGLIEDINYFDAATDLLIPEKQISKAKLIAKADGIVSGIEVFEMVFKLIDSEIDFKSVFKDGDHVTHGDVILTMIGKTQTILKGERLALNFLQRMSGIASLSNRYSQAVEGISVRVVDTRKTTPNLRILEKYAVSAGGCYNHRFNLSDAMMIKDNHIQAVGSIKKAIEKGKQLIPHTMKIEVEVKNLDELKEALDAGADIIMLDNMTINEMKQAVIIADHQAIIEASGGIDLNNIREVALTGVDIISVGALTHSYQSLDISLLIE